MSTTFQAMSMDEQIRVLQERPDRMAGMHNQMGENIQTSIEDQNRESVQERPVDGGFEPANNKVLVLPDPVPTESVGGIKFPGDVIEREEFSQIFATLVAIGPDAWKDRKTPPAGVGDRVMIAKFTGQLFTGPDGRRYRVIHDLDIIGKITKDGVKK
jgi:co-chaperonin GroES (HSP10)